MLTRATAPEGEAAEFAVMVRTDRQRVGIGECLMDMLIGYARDHGLHRLHGTVMRENRRMLTLCDKLGFERMASEDPSLIEVSLALGPVGAPEELPR